MVFTKSIQYKQALILKNYEPVFHGAQKPRAQKVQDSHSSKTMDHKTDWS